MRRAWIRISLGVVLALVLFLPGAHGQSGVQTPAFQSGEAGLPMQWLPNGADGINTPVNLTGGTVVLWVIPQPAPMYAVPLQLPCTVSIDGSTATHTMAATDFPVDGGFNLQFIVTYSPSDRRKSPVDTIQVGKSLDQAH